MSYELGSALRLRDGVEVVGQVTSVGLDGRRGIVLYLRSPEGTELTVGIPDTWRAYLAGLFEEVGA